MSRLGRRYGWRGVLVWWLCGIWGERSELARSEERSNEQSDEAEQSSGV